jgi:hypothetical protein
MAATESLIEKQNDLPNFWRDSDYPDSFNTEVSEHRHFTHAMTHAMKALGRISGVVDDWDHQRMQKWAGVKVAPDEGEIWRWLADLVICSLRMAQQQQIDLESAVERRIEQLKERWPAAQGGEV